MNFVHRAMAWGSILLAVASLLVGEIEHSSVTVENNQIDVFDVAELIKQRQVVLTDMRAAAERDEFQLPGALGLSAALAYLEGADRSLTVVVYGYEDHRNWMPLKSTGQRVLFLANGVEQWLEKILSPVIYRFAKDTELAAFERHVDISKYFGGVPRYSSAPLETVSVADQIERVRRGCGF